MHQSSEGREPAARFFSRTRATRRGGFFFCSEKKMRKIIFTFICFTLASSIFAADESETQTQPADENYGETLIVTADRVTEPLKDAGSAVTVITREEIEKRKEPFLLDLLRSVPGVYISQSGSAGKTTSIFIRGAGSAQSLVMFDGVQINDSLNFATSGT
jgi:vitamin B12 transporter